MYLSVNIAYLFGFKEFPNAQIFFQSRNHYCLVTTCIIHVLTRSIDALGACLHFQSTIPIPQPHLRYPVSINMFSGFMAGKRKAKCEMRNWQQLAST